MGKIFLLMGKSSSGKDTIYRELIKTKELGLNPGPYFFIAVFCYNSEFLLPVSVRAIPVGYGLDPSEMMKKGIVPFLVRALVSIVVGYAFLRLWPGFGTLS